MSPQANSPGTPGTEQSLSVFRVSSISGIAPRSMERSADDLPPSSMKTPSTGRSVPSPRTTDFTSPSPRISFTEDSILTAPAASAFFSSAGSAPCELAIQKVSDAYFVMTSAPMAASDSDPTTATLLPL